MPDEVAGPDPPGPDEPIAQECVEGYLFAREPLRALLFRRTPARESIWVPISGKVEPDDAGFEAALGRELEEETGLKAPRAVRALDWVVRFRRNRAVWRLHAYSVEVAPDFVPRLSREHAESAWLTFETARSRLHYPDNRTALDRLAARESPPPRNR